MAGTSKPNPKKKLDIKASLKEAQAAERVVKVCLRGDLNAAVTELEEQKIRRYADAPESLAGPPDTSDLDRQIEDVQAKMAEHTFAFRLRELSWRRWDKLETMHPPRADRESKERVNPETFLPALVRASVVEPVLDAEDWDLLLGRRDQHPGDCQLDDDTVTNEHCTCVEAVLSKSQFGMLSDAAIALNSNKDSSVPLSVLGSMLRQLSANG